jgi:hypothetical protein
MSAPSREPSFTAEPLERLVEEFVTKHGALPGLRGTRRVWLRWAGVHATPKPSRWTGTEPAQD